MEALKAYFQRHGHAPFRVGKGASVVTCLRHWAC